MHNGALNVWTQHYDLHSHSTNSDGEHSVEFVAGLMNDNGVKVWSLTDHDTIAGWKTGEESARALGLTFIPGVEITCERGLNPRSEELIRNKRERASRSWHLLAYFPKLAYDDKHAIEFAKWLKPLQDNRIPRMRKMVDKLAELGMPVNFEDILAAYEYIVKEELIVTDDAAAADTIGVKCSLVKNTQPNPKLTSPGDLLYIEYLLKKDN